MKTEPSEEQLTLMRGLVLLMVEESRYFRHLDQCSKYCSHRTEHPFGLDLPERDWAPLERIVFTGAGATDMSVEVFLANIRFWSCYTKNGRVTKLRVINMPVSFSPEEKEHHYVFFEAWVGSQVFISGETTDCSGAGNAARNELESVFAVLSHCFGIKVERITLSRIIKIRELYKEPVN